MSITVKKIAGAGLLLVSAAGYAIKSGMYVSGCLAALVGLACLVPAFMQFVEGRKKARRLTRMGK